MGTLWLAGLPARVGAELYRWVDETGTTVYSQRPPPAATPTTPIKPNAPPPAQEVQRANQRLRSQVEKEFDQREQQAREAAKAAKEAPNQAARRANCEAARKNLETLGRSGLGILETPDGKYLTLSPDQLAAQKALALSQIKENCN